MNKRTISKLDAAREQLDAAIEMYFLSKSVVALHTITAAAYNIIRDLSIKDGSYRPFIKTEFINNYSESLRKKLHKFINRPENFFKHANNDPDGVLEFDPEMTEILLIDACAYFSNKNEDKPKYYDIFKGWVGVPNKTLNEEMKILVEAAIEAFKTQGKREYWNFAIQHLNSGAKRTS